MGCISIPFQRLPHQPKLFLRFLNDFSSVSQFYPHPPSLEAIQQAAKTLDYPEDRRKEIAAILRETNAALGAGEGTANNIDRLANGAVAVLSGQQVGLFGGPAYAFYKAVSAIQIAHELTESGVDAVPIFWMATEDHDLDEVRHVSWFHAGKRTRFELPAAETPGRPVGQIKLGAAVEEIAGSAAELLAGASSPLVARYLQESYSANETYGTAFGKLFARVFADYGLILVDPLDARLHRVAGPIYRKALADRASLNAKLLQRDKDLEAAGFAPQVKVTPETTLLFQIRDGIRQPIVYHAEHGGQAGAFKIGDAVLNETQVLQLADSSPETLSPNALLRPVVQDYLFPTVAFCTGSAEISYLAQSEVLYREILGHMPVLLPRADFTILDAKADKLLQKYRLCIENLWSGPQQLRKQMESISLPAQLAEDFDKKKALIDSTLTDLGADIQKLDATLAGAVETTREKMSFQLNKLREKTGRALDERAGLIAEHSDFLENLLYPDRVLQSRELSFLPFLAQWGPTGIEELKNQSASSNLREHRIARITQ
ncbi:MAG: bacillithiol biosynthesis cysteine-adding enzyme BshC [Acidobacteria bacterium]|nr:bacillithiol biosynthesis cysteine-adding enzyme BshC [Acidobacteriota bacterium]